MRPIFTNAFNRMLIQGTPLATSTTWIGPERQLQAAPRGVETAAQNQALHRPIVESAAKGSSGYFAADPRILMGNGDEDNTTPQIAVGVDAQSFNMPARLLPVRQRGIHSKADIELAIEYLSKLSKPYKSLLHTIQQQQIPIELGPLDLTYSYARLTFQGAVDRNSPNFGQKIVIQRGATPDVLLHEAVHAVPLDILQDLPSALKIKDRDFIENINKIVTQLPIIDPNQRFFQIRQAILEHSRINETLSFGLQCSVFELEPIHRLYPIFYSEMMRDLAEAWVVNQFDGVRATFPLHLPHYEDRLGRTSVLLALIVKVQGRTGLTEEEEQIVDNASYLDYVKYLQTYLDQYVEMKGLELPPGFYALPAIMKRTPLLSSQSSTDRIVAAVDSLFETLEVTEEQAVLATLPAVAPLTSAQLPPSSSQAARQELFVAYSGVVDRVLDNPPAALSREELASLISYLRMVPPAVAWQLTERLKIYFGPEAQDLQVTVGLILYDKGFREQGEQMVRYYLTFQELSQTLSPILQIIGPELVQELVDREVQDLKERQAELATRFQTWALPQYLWEGADWQAAFGSLFRYPEMIESTAWNDVGCWLFEHGEVDSHLEDDEILAVSSHLDQEILQNYRREQSLLATLAQLMSDPRTEEPLRDRLQTHWDQLRDRQRERAQAVLKVLQLAPTANLIFFLGQYTEQLRHYDATELKIIFQDYPDPLKQRMVTLAQLYSEHPWTYPDVLTALTSEAADIDDISTDDDISKYDWHTRILRATTRKAVTRGESLAAELPPHMEPIRETFSQAPPFTDIDLTEIMPHDYIAWLKRSDNTYHEPLNSSERLYEGPTNLSPDESTSIQVVAWHIHALQQDPSRAPEYLNEILSQLEELARFIAAEENDLIRAGWTMTLFYTGHYVLDRVIPLGLETEAEALFRLLYQQVPQQLPLDEIWHTDQENRHTLTSFFPSKSAFLQALSQQEWSFRMEQARRHATDAETRSEWMHRIREELGRGGRLISIQGLAYFASGLIGEDDIATAHNLFHMMVKKALLEPNHRNIAATFQEIQSAPLSDSDKDRLLLALVTGLFDMIQGFRGLNLRVLQELQGLFPWKTPFMKAGDIPYYPETEALLIDRLAQIPELTTAQHDKQDRVRLAAFAAAGLPLQRYAEWHVHSFNDPDANEALHSLKNRKGDWSLYRQLDLPHPYTIPTDYGSEQVARFWREKRAMIESALNGSDQEQARAVTRLLARILGSELRGLHKERARGKRTYLAGQQLGLNEAETARQLRDWLRAQYSSDTPSEHCSTVQEILFSAVPPAVRVLDVAAEILDWPLDRSERRQVFEQASRHLVFSRQVQERIQALQEADDEEAERAYYRWLLPIQYHRHPGGMISDFLLRRLEQDPNMRQAYQKALIGETIDNPYLIAELGLHLVESDYARGQDYVRFSPLERFELYLRAIQFLKQYMIIADDNAYAGDNFISFRKKTVSTHREVFGPLLEATGSQHGLSDWDQARDMSLHGQLSSFQEILVATGWADFVGHVLDAMGGDQYLGEDNYEAVFADEESFQAALQAVPASHRPDEKQVKSWLKSIRELSDKEKTDLLNNSALMILDQAIVSLGKQYEQLVYEDLNDRLLDSDLPPFIDEREGLERDLLLWTLMSLRPEQRTLLGDRLSDAQTDEEKLLHLGRAAHFEKLLQQASINPAVPRAYQEQFEVFQDEVPPQDATEIDKAFRACFLDAEQDSITIDSRRPVKEGTIGGVYRGTYQGESVLFKLIADEKEKNLRDSLRIVADIRRYLRVTDFQAPGARTIDDLLAFYERTLSEELNLDNELKNAAKLEPILPAGFAIPTFIHELTFLNIAAMEPLYSRHLRDLSAGERKNAFERIDRELIPKMLLSGIFHYDLHPGNIGVQEDGTIVLYDVGRVHQLSDAERTDLNSFYNALSEKNVAELKETLQKMGKVRDAEAFANIDELLQELLSYDNPLEALKTIYPRLADYGYLLADSYVKLLFMFLTWEGTKHSFNGHSS